MRSNCRCCRRCRRRRRFYCLVDNEKTIVYTSSTIYPSIYTTIIYREREMWFDPLTTTTKLYAHFSRFAVVLLLNTKLENVVRVVFFICILCLICCLDARYFYIVSAFLTLSLSYTLIFIIIIIIIILWVYVDFVLS